MLTALYEAWVVAQLLSPAELDPVLDLIVSGTATRGLEEAVFGSRKYRPCAVDRLLASNDPELVARGLRHSADPASALTRLAARDAELAIAALDLVPEALDLSPDGCAEVFATGHPGLRLHLLKYVRDGDPNLATYLSWAQAQRRSGLLDNEALKGVALRTRHLWTLRVVDDDLEALALVVYRQPPAEEVLVALRDALARFVAEHRAPSGTARTLRSQAADAAVTLATDLLNRRMPMVSAPERDLARDVLHAVAGLDTDTSRLESRLDEATALSYEQRVLDKIPVGTATEDELKTLAERGHHPANERAATHPALTPQQAVVLAEHGWWWADDISAFLNGRDPAWCAEMARLLWSCGGATPRFASACQHLSDEARDTLLRELVELPSPSVLNALEALALAPPIDLVLGVAAENAPELSSSLHERLVHTVRAAFTGAPEGWSLLAGLADSFAGTFGELLKSAAAIATKEPA